MITQIITTYAASLVTQAFALLPLFRFIFLINIKPVVRLQPLT